MGCTTGRKPLNRYQVLIDHTAIITFYVNARNKAEAKSKALKKYREITITKLSKNDPEYREVTHHQYRYICTKRTTSSSFLSQ